jgi:hypothetical protein
MAAFTGSTTVLGQPQAAGVSAMVPWTVYSRDGKNILATLYASPSTPTRPTTGQIWP